MCIVAAVMLLQPHRVWAQLGLAVAASASYPALLAVTGFFRPEERAAILAAIQRIGRLARPAAGVLRNE
jgi:hypothetical protein